MSIIEVEHLTKEFKLGQLESLKTTALNQARRIFGQPVEQRALFKALDDVSFSIEAGEVVGIIGHNGAGKSTLLKLLANISTPTSGRIRVDGRIAPLIEVGAGFIPELTGRENVYLNGSILGLSRKAIDRKFDEIVEFAEMTEFIDTPVKRYSSGMQVKLAFSVATSIDAEILIVDEVLAVGDLAFQRKCFDRMESLIKQQRKTVLLVSHNIRQVERICTRAILLSKGQLVTDALPTEVCDLYYEQSDLKIYSQIAQSENKLFRNLQSTDELEILKICFLDEQGNETTTVTQHSKVTIVIDFMLRDSQQHLTFGLGVHTTDLLYLCTSNTELEFPRIDMVKGQHQIRFDIHRLPLSPGVFSLRFGATASEAARTLYYAESLLSFQVLPPKGIRQTTTMRDGFFSLDAKWTISPDTVIAS